MYLLQHIEKILPRNVLRSQYDMINPGLFIRHKKTLQEINQGGFRGELGFLSIEEINYYQNVSYK